MIVGCGKSKLDRRAPARELYTGQLFRSHMELAVRLPARRLMILSAFYGLIDQAQEIDPYEVTVTGMTADARNDWGRAAALAVEAASQPKELVIVLAGAGYLRWADECARRISTPLASMTTGERRSVIRGMVHGQAAPLTVAAQAAADDESEVEPPKRGQLPMWGYFACGGCGHRQGNWGQTCEKCGHRGMDRTDTGPNESIRRSAGS